MKETVQTLSVTIYFDVSFSKVERWQGYYGDGKICHDVDECSNDPYNLTKLDNSTQQYWWAVHYNSTRLQNSTRIHNCDLFATCSNTIGSFTCRCNNGRWLTPNLFLVQIFESHLLGHIGNGTQCEDVNECYANEYSNHTCNDYEKTECINTVGTYNCSCIKGYSVVENMKPIFSKLHFR